MKKILLSATLVVAAATAHAQSSSTAQQSSTSQSVAQGTIQFSQSPADQHFSETVRNVSAPILGAYAASFSQMNCGSTTQVGAAVAGFSIAGGTAKDSATCVLEVAAAESVRQSTVSEDGVLKDKLQKAAAAIRCQVSEEVYKAYTAAGIDCMGLKPASMVTREDSQPANYRVASK